MLRNIISLKKKDYKFYRFYSKVILYNVNLKTRQWVYNCQQSDNVIVFKSNNFWRLETFEDFLKLNGGLPVVYYKYKEVLNDSQKAKSNL